MGIHFLLISVLLLVKFVFNVDLDFKVNSVIQSHMVLQREPYKSSIWGTGKTNSVVNLVMGDIKGEAQVDENGHWQIFIDPQPASDVPKSMVVTNNESTNKYQFDNILFGDVFLCSGQSNMEFSIKAGFDADQTFEEAKNTTDKIRIFTVDNNYQPDSPVEELNGKVRQYWSEVTPQSLGADLSNLYYYFSAVCYYYGVNIHRAIHVPIGLIATSWGGTLIESWTPADAITKCSDLIVWGPPCDKPGSLYNGMIHPFLPFTIKGALWYQGEANLNHPGNYYKNEGYECIFSVMINEWRKRFSKAGGTDPNFPFGFVQLAGYCDIGDHKCTNEKAVHDIRWAQTLSYGYAPNPLLNNTFFAVSIDLPDPLDPPTGLGDIHPRNKKDVSKRLANAALGLIYQQHKSSITGPLVNGCVSTPGYIEISIRRDSIPDEIIEIKDNLGFEVLDSSDNTWKAVNVTKILGLTISLNTGVSSVSGIRYLWHSNPCCPEAYTSKTPFTCPMSQCGIYSTVQHLPLIPFNYPIKDGSCVIPSE